VKNRLIYDISNSGNVLTVDTRHTSSRTCNTFNEISCVVDSVTNIVLHVSLGLSLLYVHFSIMNC